MDVKTKNGSFVAENAAGIESTAKIASAKSIVISASISGVMAHRPSIRVKKLDPTYTGDTGKIDRASRTAMFLSRSGSASSFSKNSLTAVSSRNAPKT